MLELKYSSGGVIYHPVYFKAEGQGRPLIVEIHGGGFCFGKAEDDVALCERLKKETGYDVVSLDYRLSPQFRYPLPVNDCVAQFKAIMADGSLSFDRNKIIIIGHSAGANLAVALAVQCGCASALVLDYPWLELSKNRRKYHFASIPGSFLGWMAKKYCPDKELRGTSALSPVYMSAEELISLPETLIITAGCDSLRADGIAFAERLQAAGVKVEHAEYKHARHGFIEIVSSGRQKKNFYTSAKTVQQQFTAYEGAIAKICAFIRTV